MARAGDQIENPLTGERIVFRRTAAQTEGKLLEMDAFWTRPGHRAPAHVHPEMEERWELIAGMARFRIAELERTVGPGESLLAPPGVPHLAWNVGAGPVHVRIQMRPALRWEEFVERLFELARQSEQAGRELAQPDLAALLSEFHRELALP